MSFKSQIDGVIDTYGTDINLVPITITYNDYGDQTTTLGTATTIKSVPYNYTFLTNELQKMGVQVNASQYFILKGDQTINNDYEIQYDSKTFKIKSVEEYVLQGVILAKLVIVNQTSD